MSTKVIKKMKNTNWKNDNSCPCLARAPY